PSLAASSVCDNSGDSLRVGSLIMCKFAQALSHICSSCVTAENHGVELIGEKTDYILEQVTLFVICAKNGSLDLPVTFLNISV
ncbi:unnamed protein product, partial [Bubo scandiacus]